jgi:type VI secretion system protein ImpE
MIAEENLRAGRLEESLTQLQNEVRADPANPKLRIFLFQLLSLVGKWERALNQLNVVGDLDQSALGMVQTYREALRCEAFRTEVFEGKRSPMLFGQPTPWMALLLEAHRLTALKQYANAEPLRKGAFDAAPAISGTIDGQPFEWIADADSRFGPMLEAIVNGRYYWIPFESLSEIRVEESSDLRDLIWMPAYLTLVNGGELVGFIPTRYPGSDSSPDGQIRMSRKTEWVHPSDDTYMGLGQRMLATDQTEFPLMDIRSIVLNSAQAENHCSEAECVPSNG